MENLVNGPEIPMGLGMALAQNHAAMEVFAAMPPASQQSVIEHTHQISLSTHRSDKKRACFT